VTKEDVLSNELTDLLPRENANCSVDLSTLGVLLVKKNLAAEKRNKNVQLSRNAFGGAAS
jgi:hypothetical protein